MSKDFDPHHKWLGIPAREQPADHYRLLGVERFEDDADVISLAADQRMQFLRSLQNGERAKLSQQLLNEVAKAKVCLLDSDKKTAYDKELRQTINKEKEAESENAQAPSEDLAATVEFAAPDSVPDWPPGLGDESESGNLWNPKSDASAMTPISSPTPLTRKVKIRTLVVSILASTLVILSLVILVNAVLVEPKPTAQKETILQDKQEATPQLLSEVERKAEAASKLAAANRKSQEEAKRKAEAEKKAAAEAKKKAAAEAKKKAAAEAEAKKKAEAERQARIKAQQERMKLTIKLLQQSVDQSIEKADRLKDNPRQARKIIRESINAVQNASVPSQVKQSQKRILHRMATEIEKVAAAQIAQKRKEDEDIWRREHPEEYLESVGLVKEKNGWEFKAAIEIDKLRLPLGKLISEYKKTSSAYWNGNEKIAQKENELHREMGAKLPGPFRDRAFRQWVLDGRQRFGNESNPTRQKLDDWEMMYGEFRDLRRKQAAKLDGHVNSLRTAKEQMRHERNEMKSVGNNISSKERRVNQLLKLLERREMQVEQEKGYVQAALQSTGLSINEPDITKTENLMKKAEGIFNEDLFEKIVN